MDINIGNSIESCMDVGTSRQWIWGNTYDGEKQSHMGCLKNASPSWSVSNMVSPTIKIILSIITVAKELQFY